MRLFIAIDIPPDIIPHIEATREKLIATKADVKWVNPDNYHITVKFIGDVDDSRLTELSDRLDKAAHDVPAFELEVEGIDRLPPKGPVRVITSRILSPDQRMTRLHRLINSAVGGMGLPMDTRVLVPHLTLGRVRSNHGINRLLRLLEKHDLDFFGAFTASHITLYSSTLGTADDGGSTYTPLHKSLLRQIETPADHASNSAPQQRATL